jgi:hypothetical protein
VARRFRAKGEGGYQSFRRFVRSYIECPAGLAHELIVIFKGFEAESNLAAAKAEFAGTTHREIFVTDDHFDIGAYLQGARQCEADYVCFVNTHTQIVSPNWLAHLRSAIGDRAIGLAGAYGSFESLYDSLALTSKAVWLAGIVQVPFDRRLAACYRFVLETHAPRYYTLKARLRGLFKSARQDLDAKWAAYWKSVCTEGSAYGFLPRFPRFPNPHLRSNGFIVERKELLSLFSTIDATKTAAYAFESGGDSLSAKITRSGKQLVVVDRHGKVYRTAEWTNSKTFRLADQSDVLFTDNQTRAFDQLSDDERNIYVMMTWGWGMCDHKRAYALGLKF